LISVVAAALLEEAEETLTDELLEVTAVVLLLSLPHPENVKDAASSEAATTLRICLFAINIPCIEIYS
jgi:hypothetical protein